MTTPTFRYYITDIETFEIFGTNDYDVANEASYQDTTAVVDTQTNMLITLGETEEIKEYV